MVSMVQRMRAMRSSSRKCASAEAIGEVDRELGGLSRSMSTELGIGQPVGSATGSGAASALSEDFSSES